MAPGRRPTCSASRRSCSAREELRSAGPARNSPRRSGASRRVARHGGRRAGAGPPAPRLRLPGLRRAGRRSSPLRAAMDALTERRPPRWGRLARRMAAWLLIGVPVLLVLALLLSEDVRYVARAGVEEARILFRRRPIAPLVADARTAPALRQPIALLFAGRASAPAP